MRGGSISRDFFIMESRLIIEQKPALILGLTLTQAATYSLLLEYSLTADKQVINDKLYYRFTYKDLSDKYPLLFKNPKRAYKTMHLLEQKGCLNILRAYENKYFNITA